ncbi:MAG: aminoglycoside phosphotransferase family protein [Anaerolineales bacterium]|nr:MAG: aminoglycoside phosphotransferase family protein [Anaerolineales bacterium]
MTTYPKTRLLPVIETWEAWGQVFTKVALWKPAVQEICRRASIPLESIETGYPGTNAVFVVNQRYVVKIYAPFCHDDYHLERELLTKLGEKTLIPAPAILARGILEDSISWPYIIMEYLSGQPIREVREKIDHANLLEITAHMGTIVRVLHKIPIASLNNLDRSQSGWQRYCQHQLKTLMKKLQRNYILPDPVIEAIPAFVADEIFKGRASKNTPLALVHGDLTEDHWLLDDTHGHWSLSGLFDFADAKISPATYEWVALWFGALDRNHENLASFMHSYDPTIMLDDDFYRRAMAYTFLHEFGAEIIDNVLPEHIRNDIPSIEHLVQVLWCQ